MLDYLRFASANFLVYLGEVSLTLFLTETFGLWYMQSYLIALLSGIFILFFYHNHITFKIKGDYHKINHLFLISLLKESRTDSKNYYFHTVIWQE